MEKAIRIGVLAMSLLWVQFATAKVLDQPLRFKNFTVYDGLSANTVQTIAQDFQGFLWLGTSYGLTRYNGYDFELFEMGSNGKALSDQEIFSLLVSGNYLWIGTSKSIERLDLSTYELKTYDYSVDNVITGAIAQTPDGRIWFGRWGTGLLCYNPFTDTIEPVALPVFDSATLFSLHTGTGGKLWIGTEKQGVFYFDPRYNLVKRLLIPNDIGNEKISRISSLFEKDSVLYLACHGSGLFAYSLKTNLLEPVYLVNNRSPNKQFSVIIPDKRGNFWIGGDQSGILVYNPTTSDVDHYRSISYDHTSLSGDVIKCLFFDREESLWVGTGNKGLNQSCYYSGKGFSYFSFLSHEMDWVSLHFISILNRGNQATWLGTNGQGLYYFDRKKALIKKAILPPALEHAAIIALQEDSHNNLYFSVYPRQFYKARVVQPNLELGIREISPIELPELDIRAILPDGEGKFWLGTDGQGLVLWDEKKGIMEQYLKHWPSDSISLPGNFVRNLAQGKDKKFWIATTEGFARFDQEKKKINSFFFGNLKEMSDFRINSILETQEGKLWLATRQGIYCSVLTVGQIDDSLSLGVPVDFGFIHYAEEDGLSHNNINGLLEDEEGLIWSTSENGINCIDQATGRIDSYDRGDGLGGNLFSSNAITMNGKGEILLAGEHGLSLIRPDAIKAPDFRNRVIVEELWLSGEKVMPGQVINRRVLLEKIASQTSEIELNPRENSFDLHFSALSFIDPRGIRYEYKLEGFDSGWRPASALNRIATYTNLYPGTYTFKVRGTNSDLSWVDEPTSMVIRVKPPFWASWWFLTLIIVIIVISVRLIIYFRIIQQKTIQIGLERQIAERTREIIEQNALLASRTEDLKKANQVKDLFFNIIAHDLINPVSSSHQLIEMIDHNLTSMSIEEIKKLLGSAVKSTRQTLDLLQNLLVWARNQSKSIVYKKNKSDISTLVGGVMEQLRQQARQKEITLINQIEKPTYCIADEYTMQTVFRNLISNAIKFSFNGNYVQAGALRSGKDYHFFVKDQGTGISSEQVSLLFNPDNHLTRKGTQGEKGTGLGLKLCYDFVAGNDGRIWAESIEGKGTTIWIALKAAQ